MFNLGQAKHKDLSIKTPCYSSSTPLLTSGPLSLFLLKCPPHLSECLFLLTRKISAQMLPPQNAFFQALLFCNRPPHLSSIGFLTFVESFICSFFFFLPNQKVSSVKEGPCLADCILRAHDSTCSRGKQCQVTPLHQCNLEMIL